MNISPTHLSSQMRFMRNYDATEVKGLQVNMKTTDKKHINSHPNQSVNNNDTVQNFGNLLMNFLKSVNNDQIKATNMQQLAITNPEKVNVHQVTAAMTKAEMSIGFLKSVTDKLMSGYRELSNLR